jgi:hypothetical protein
MSSGRLALVVSSVMFVASLVIVGPTLLRADGDDWDPRSSPLPPPVYAEPMIPGGQQIASSGPTANHTTTYVALPGTVTVNNTTSVAKLALLRWSGRANVYGAGNWAYLAPVRDGVVLDPGGVGNWYAGWNNPGHPASTSDSFLAQFTVSIPPGVHTLGAAFHSAYDDGGANYLAAIGGSHITVELKTK